MSDDGGTIGSRLRRKRRITTSFHGEDSTPSRKRARRTLSPSSKNVTPTASQSVSARGKRKSRLSSNKAKSSPEAPTSPRPDDRVVSEATANGSSLAQENPISQKIDEETSGSNEQPIQLDNLSLLGQYKRMLPSSILLESDESYRDDIIGKIIDHLEKLADLEQLSQEYGKGMDTEGLPTMGAGSTLKAQAVPILDNLTKQILHAFATNGIHDLVRILADPESKAGEVCGIQSISKFNS